MKKTKVLIVEDEAITAMRVKMELENLGYETFEPVATGEKAVEIAEQEHPDAILMDIFLADEMDGITAAQIIQSSCKTHIIFITGNDNKDIKEKAEKLNPDDYLIKPVPISIITAAIDSAVEK